MKNKKIQKGQEFHIDTYRVSQYENIRICSSVIIQEQPKKYQKKILCYSSELKSDILVYIKDLLSKK